MRDAENRSATLRRHSTRSNVRAMRRIGHGRHDASATLCAFGRAEGHVVPGGCEPVGELVDDDLYAAVAGRGRGEPGWGDLGDPHALLLVGRARARARSTGRQSTPRPNAESARARRRSAHNRGFALPYERTKQCMQCMARAGELVQDNDARCHPLRSPDRDTPSGPRIRVMREQWEYPPPPPRIRTAFWSAGEQITLPQPIY